MTTEEAKVARRVFPCLALILCALSLAVAITGPERSKGISMHMLPKGVADLGRERWGFVVTRANYLNPEAGAPTLQTTDEFRAFVRKQSASVQENGVWIVVTDPDAYSEPEKALLESVKVLCQKESIPLFICRGIDLPNGWKRYDRAH